MAGENINYISVLIAAIANMLIGMFWYSKFAFGKAWMSLAGKSEKDIKDMKKGGAATRAYIFSFIGTLITAYALAYFINVTKSASIVEGARIGFWAWIFVATATAANMLFEGKPKRLYILNNCYNLISYTAMGAILVLLK